MKFLLYKESREKEWNFKIKGSDSILRILVIDTNLAIDHAVRFAKDGHIVYYYLADLSAFPKLEDRISGYGFEGITKIEDWASVFKEVDLIYITDNCFPELAVLAKELGKLVYGPTPLIVKLEDDRVFAYEMMKSLGIAVPEGESIKGIENLINWIKERQGENSRFWIKINKFRGDIETFSASNALEAMTLLSQSKLGPFLENLEFLVQYDTAGIEIGCDANICPKGLLKPYFYTIEHKGRGNVAIPKINSGFETHFYDKLMNLIKEDDYRCNLSVEGIWDGESFKVIDITSRIPYPVSSLYPRFIKNFTEVIYCTANNEPCKVEIDEENPLLLEITVSTDLPQYWRTIEFPEKYKENIGFRRVIYFENKYWFVPDDFLVATINVKGKSLEEVFNKGKEILSSVKCIYSQYDISWFEVVKEQISQLNQLGSGFEWDSSSNIAEIIS